MNWADIIVPGGAVVIGWIITARTMIILMQRVGELRERVAFLEAKVNGKGER